MATPPSPKSGLSPTLPPGQTKTSYSSAYVQVELFVFKPTLVSAFVHRPANEESAPLTEVFYESHHISVPDPNQALFFYLQNHTRPQKVATTL